ncbi:IS200/IS605 family transposase [uncultured Muribaculum sp.]|uniref:IS200/IS605 family transposase n=1 Tax=uncultured Muribaculum sp. TaxID=1918613 RepID=UPI00259437F7|nr:IS200/IS605 family transposase [uncultured Muribaculum sp.]
MSKVTSLHHIVFCTKYREMTIPQDHCEDLYRFIWAEIKKSHSKLIRIGGIQNHLHLLVDVSPNISLSALMRNIKACSSGWMKHDGRFPKFRGWAHEYFAVSVNSKDKINVIDYIKRQPVHHASQSFTQELTVLAYCAGFSFDADYMM